VNNVVMTFVMFRKFVNLSMTVVTSGNYVCGPCILYLGILDFAVSKTFILVSGLEETATAATTEVVGTVGIHVDEVFLADGRFYDKSKIFCCFVTKCLSDDLARILNSKFDFEIFVPIGVGFKLTFTYPFGVHVIDMLDITIVFNVELFQSCQDCKCDVPSLRVEIRLAPQLVSLADAHPGYLFPAWIIRKEEAVIFTSPASTSVSPVCSYKI